MLFSLLFTRTRIPCSWSVLHAQNCPQKLTSACTSSHACDDSSLGQWNQSGSSVYSMITPHKLKCVKGRPLTCAGKTEFYLWQSPQHAGSGYCCFYPTIPTITNHSLDDGVGPERIQPAPLTSGTPAKQKRLLAVVRLTQGRRKWAQG